MPFDPKLRFETHAAFRFVVEVNQLPLAAFTECTLPAIEWDIEEVKEGGLNSFVHQLPGQRKAAKVTLKRGVGKSQLLFWYLAAMNGIFIRLPITIRLVELKKGLPVPMMTWIIADAFPSKWSGPELRSDSNTVAIQTLELAGGEIFVW